MSRLPVYLSPSQNVPISEILEVYLESAEQQERDIRSTISSLREREASPSAVLAETWMPGVQGSDPDTLWTALEARVSSVVQEVRDACVVAGGGSVDLQVRDRIAQIKQHIRGEVRRERNELLALHAEVRELTQLRDYPLAVSRQRYAEVKKEACEQAIRSLARLFEDLEAET